MPPQQNKDDQYGLEAPKDYGLQAPTAEPPNQNPDLPGAGPNLINAVKSGTAPSTFSRPTRFELERRPEDSSIWRATKAIGSDLGIPANWHDAATGLLGKIAFPFGNPAEDLQRARDFLSSDAARKQTGSGLPYRIAAGTAQLTGVGNPNAMEEAAAHGDMASILGHTVVPLAGAALGADEALTGGKGIGAIQGAGKGIIRNLSEGFKEAPDIAAQRALAPPKKQAVRMQTNLAGARPYLEGAENLQDLQNRIPQAKGEVWQPYKDVIDKIKDREVMGPEGKTTIGELEAERLKTSARLQELKKLNPMDQQTLLQKETAVKELNDRYKRITGALDPELKSQGIDPELIRRVHGNISGIQRLVEGRNTLTENQPFGIGRIARNFDIMHPIRSLTDVGQGVRDILAGRPIWSGSPTDIAVREGFREAPSGPAAKPNLIPGPAIIPPVKAPGPVYWSPANLGYSQLWQQQIGPPPNLTWGKIQPKVEPIPITPEYQLGAAGVRPMTRPQLTRGPVEIPPRLEASELQGTGIPQRSVQRGAKGRMQRVYLGISEPAIIGHTAEGGPIYEEQPSLRASQQAAGLSNLVERRKTPGISPTGTERRTLPIGNIQGPPPLRGAQERVLQTVINDPRSTPQDVAIATSQLADLRAHPFEKNELPDINQMKAANKKTLTKEEAEANVEKRKTGRNQRFAPVKP